MPDFTVKSLTDSARPLAHQERLDEIRELQNRLQGLNEGMAANLQALLHRAQQPQPHLQHQPQPQVRAHRHFQNAINPLVHLDPQAQAAQDRFRRQLREANQADQQARHAQDVADLGQRNLVPDGRALAEDHMVRWLRMRQGLDRMPEEQLRQRAHLMEQFVRNRRVREWVGAVPPPLPAQPAFGEARNAGADAGMGRGLAFGGLDANRAARGPG